MNKYLSAGVTVSIVISLLCYKILSDKIEVLKSEHNWLEFHVSLEDNFNRAGLITFDQLGISLGRFEALLSESGYVNEDIQSYIGILDKVNEIKESIDKEQLYSIPNYNFLYSPSMTINLVLSYQKSLNNLEIDMILREQISQYLDNDGSIDLDMLITRGTQEEQQFARKFILLQLLILV